MEQAVLHAIAQIAPWIAVAYLVDCVWRVPHGHALLTSATGRRFRWRDSGWAFASLSPFALAVRTWRPPLLVTADGVFVLRRAGVDGVGQFERSAYDFLDSAAASPITTAGPEFALGASGDITCPSAAEAQHWAGSVVVLRQLSPESCRIAYAAKLQHARFDDAALRSEMAAVMPMLTVLRAVSAAALVSALAVIAVGITGDLVPAPLRHAVYAVAATALVSAPIVALIAAWKLRRRGIIPPPGALLGICLYPLAAWHAAATLACHVGWRYDFLTVAHAFLSPSAFQRLARSELAAAGHALADSDAPAWQAYWQIRRDAIAQLCERAGVDVAELAAPPDRAGERPLTVCAFCGSEYRIAVAVCSDCGAATQPRADA